MSGLLIAALVVCSVQIACFVGAGLWVQWQFRRKEAELREAANRLIREWFVPPAEDQPHKAAEVLAALGEVVGRTAAQSIMASIAAERASVARQANGAAEDIMAAQNPLLGLLSGGKKGKGAAIAKLAGLLGPMLAGPKGNGSDQAAGQSVRERLRKGG